MILSYFIRKRFYKQDVHVDPSWEWGAVIYMSDPKDCVDEGGTSFWRHNSLKIENIPKIDFEAQHHGWPHIGMLVDYCVW